MIFHHSPPSLRSVAFLLPWRGKKKKKLREIKVYFRHQLQNALKALTKGVTLFKSKKTPNASSPTQHKKTRLGNGLSFQRSLECSFNATRKEGVKTGEENGWNPTFGFGENFGIPKQSR